MKSILFSVLAVFALVLNSAGQSTLWGVGQNGIFEFNPVDSSINERYIFPTNTSEGSLPTDGMLKASNGMLYYTMSSGGNFGEGTINKFNPTTNTNTVVHHFDGSNGASPIGIPVEGNNNKIYGTYSGGIYEFDIQTETYIVLQTISDVKRELNVVGDFIYGVRGNADNNYFGAFYIYVYDIVNDTYNNNIYTLPYPIENTSNDTYQSLAYIYGGMEMAGNGKLYGIVVEKDWVTNTSNGATWEEYHPYIFEFDPSSGVGQHKIEVQGNGGYMDFWQPTGRMMNATSNGTLYFHMNNTDGNDGYLGEYDYSINSITKSKDLDGTIDELTKPSVGSVPAEYSDGTIYGYQFESILNNRIYGYKPEAPVFDNYFSHDFSGTNFNIQPVGNLVEVQSPPLINVHPNDFTVCEGTPDSIYVSAIGADSYQWYQEGNAISGATDSILYFNNPTPADDGYYYCELTNTFGTNNSDSALVTVYPLPNVQANASPSVICEGDTLLLVGTGADSYVWDNGVVNGIEFVPTTSEVYTVVGTDGNGCTNSASVNMPLHTIDVSFAEDTVLCGGELLATVNGDGSSYTYNWNPNTDLSCTNCPNPIASPNTVTDYHLTVSDNNGCSDNDSIVVNILAPGIDICVVTVDTTSTKNVLVWEKPVTGAIDYFTVYRDVVGTYQPVVDIPYDSLSQYIDTSAGINPNITQYRYKLSATDTCGVEGEISDYHQTIHLNTPVYNGGVVDLVWQAYEGFPTNYYYRILRDTTGNYNWEVLDSVSSSTLVYTDINPPVSGPLGYIIEIAFDGTCTSTRAVNHNSTRSNRNAISLGNGIEELSSLKTRVYPNPSREGNEMTIENNELTPVLFDLYSIEGKRIDSFTVNGSSKKIIAPPKGVYVLKIMGSGKTVDYERVIIY